MRTDGLTLLDKPAGMTSFSALNSLKSRLGTGRIGHTGTLDKFATGLLVVLIGKYTKLADLFSGLDKRYEARFILGRTTDTLDPEGQVVERGNDRPHIPPRPLNPAIRPVSTRLSAHIRRGFFYFPPYMKYIFHIT